jgi:hypothetical protein
MFFSIKIILKDIYLNFLFPYSFLNNSTKTSLSGWIRKEPTLEKGRSIVWPVEVVVPEQDGPVSRHRRFIILRITDKILNISGIMRFRFIARKGIYNKWATKIDPVGLDLKVVDMNLWFSIYTGGYKI